jgi:hypothetical protein
MLSQRRKVRHGADASDNEGYISIRKRRAAINKDDEPATSTNSSIIHILGATHKLAQSLLWEELI